MGDRLKTENRQTGRQADRLTLFAQVIVHVYGSLMVGTLPVYHHAGHVPSDLVRFA